MPFLALLFWFAIDDGRMVRDASGQVVEIDFTSTWITDADLAGVASHRRLRKLTLDHAKITDAGLEHLKPLTDLREFSCYYCEYITEDGLRHLAGWKNLETLNLRGARIYNQAAEHIARLPNLRHLDVAFTNLDDAAFDQLAGMAKLERLAIGGNRLSGGGIALLKGAASLRYLDLGGIQRVDSGLWGLPLHGQNLARIGQLTQLRGLNIAAATLNDRGTDRPGHPEAERKELRDLSALAALSNLEFLDLSRQPVSAASLAPLAKLRNLRELRLGLCTGIDDSAVEVLKSLTHVKTIYLEGTRLSTEARQKIAR